MTSRWPSPGDHGPGGRVWPAGPPDRHDPRQRSGGRQHRPAQRRRAGHARHPAHAHVRLRRRQPGRPGLHDPAGPAERPAGRGSGSCRWPRWSPRCVVDRDDPAFENPSKPIGGFMDETTARRVESERLARGRRRGPRLAAGGPEPAASGGGGMAGHQGLARCGRAGRGRRRRRRAGGAAGRRGTARGRRGHRQGPGQRPAGDA